MLNILSQQSQTEQSGSVLRPQTHSHSTPSKFPLTWVGWPHRPDPLTTHRQSTTCERPTADSNNAMSHVDRVCENTEQLSQIRSQSARLIKAKGGPWTPRRSHPFPHPGRRHPKGKR